MRYYTSVKTRVKSKFGIRAYYGGVVLLREYCPECKDYAIIIGNELQCCGLKLRPEQPDEPRVYRRRRMSEGSLHRIRISTKAKKACLRFQINQCLYCGAHVSIGTAHFDHFIPRSYSQDDSADNIVAACAKCNSLKSDLMFQTVEEARVYICQRRLERKLGIGDYYGGSYEVSKV